MKKFLLIFISLFCLLILVLGGGYLWWKQQLNAPTSDTQPNISFVVQKGESATIIIDKLSDQGLIKSKLATKIYFRLSGLQNKIKPGDYVLSKSWSVPALLMSLTVGPKDVWVTLPEGWRREQMALRLHTTINSIDITDFLAQTIQLEGQLFPDTYLMPAQATAADAVRILTANFSKKTNLDVSQNYSITLDNKSFSLTGREVLIFASLVEREAKTSSERPLIAGILLRRYRADWPLQVDATLQYALGTQHCSSNSSDCAWWQPPVDTKIPSVYNTYLHPGLPPTPIANPGKSVIDAVLLPQSSTYWYYLTGNDGVTHYAKSLQEHNLNVDKYLKS